MIQHILIVISFNDILHFDGPQKRHTARQYVLAQAQVDQPLTLIIRDRSPVHPRVLLVQGASEEAQIVAHLNVTRMRHKSGSKIKTENLPLNQHSKTLHSLPFGNLSACRRKS